MAGQTTNYLFDYPTSTDYVKDGATAIETLADDVDATLFTALGGAYPGLRLVKKQTVGTGASTVVVNDAFSATYENYRIIYTNGVCSVAPDFRISLNGITSGYFASLIYQVYNASSTVSGITEQSAASWNWVGSGSTTGVVVDVEIRQPFVTKPKKVYANFTNLGGATSAAGTMSGINASTSSATGFTLTPSGGTITGGTVYVYGYGIS
jgi:hypothetical protein